MGCCLALAACGGWGIEYLPPERLTPAPESAVEAPAAARPAASPAAAPKPAAAATAPAAPRPKVALRGTCDKCHPLTTLAESGIHQDGWGKVVADHAAAGKVTVTAEEKGSLVAQLRSAYP